MSSSPAAVSPSAIPKGRFPLIERFFFPPLRTHEASSPEVTYPSPPVRSEPTACRAVGRVGLLGITAVGRMFPLDLPSFGRIRPGAPHLTALGMT